MKRVLPMLLAGLLAGCGTLGGKPDTPAPAAGGGGVTPHGGYYLDDGPDRHPPEHLDAIPDATPRAETLLARANRPYTALGKSYTPIAEYRPYRATGIASWYGRRYHGKPTSSGEPYDMYGMTAAHPTLPIPSYARVTNLANGRTVVVRVNDRGPFKHERLIDLSYAAAHRLRLVEQGSGPVAVELVLP